MTNMNVINLALEMYGYDNTTAKGITNAYLFRNGEHKKELDEFFNSLSIEDSNRAEGLAKTLTEKVTKIWESLDTVFSRDKLSSQTRYPSLHKAYSDLMKNDTLFLMLFKGHAKIAAEEVQKDPDGKIEDLGLKVYNRISSGEKTMISKEFLAGNDSEKLLKIERTLVSINKRLINRTFYPELSCDKYVTQMNKFIQMIKQSNIYEPGNMEIANFFSEITKDKVEVVDKEYNYQCFKMDNVKRYFDVIDTAYAAEQSMVKFIQTKDTILNIIKAVESKLNNAMARRSDFNVVEIIIRILKIFLSQYQLMYRHMPRAMEVFLNTLKELR